MFSSNKAKTRETFQRSDQDLNSCQTGKIFIFSTLAVCFIYNLVNDNREDCVQIYH